MQIEIANIIVDLMTKEGPQRIEITVETKDGQTIKFREVQIEMNTGQYLAPVECVLRAAKSEYSVVQGEMRFELITSLPEHEGFSSLRQWLVD